MDAINRLPQVGDRAGYVKQAMRDKLIEHHAYVREYGQDLPEVKNWKWRQ